MNQRLELTWVGKEQELNLEPRILIEDIEKSYGDKNTDNMLIHGDNLLALKALEQSYSGRIKCVFIDPPYNTGSAFEQYDDNLEHSTWLNLMKPRLEILKKLLSDDGSIWISIDDNEMHYMRVMLDEIFGRKCFVACIVWRSSDNSNNDAKKFSVDHNYILVYSKNSDWESNRLERSEQQAKHYSNPDNDPRGPWFDGNPISSPNPRPNLCYDIIAPNGNVIKSPKNGWRWSEETLKEKMDSGEIRFNKDYTNIKRRTYLNEQKKLPPSTLWANLEETGHNRQAKYEQKKLFPSWSKNEWFATPKPEKLLQRILQLATNEGDLVLDSFLGSGTTIAVAHKMNRKWIGIEAGEHCYTHCIPRVKQVIDGIDKGGITELVKWDKGGGYKFFELAPTLFKKDHFGNWIINKEYNAEMLSNALCKIQGFKYEPDQEVYWKQGFSNENDYIYVTTNFITVEYIDKIFSEMKENESLLICCKSYQRECEDRYDNIDIKKIPQAILGKCQFDSNDYCLNVILDEWEEGDYEIDG